MGVFNPDFVSRLTAAFAESDELRRQERVERDLWLSQYKKDHGVTVGRLDTMSILGEIERCYVEGLFISAIILSICFIEHVVMNSLIANMHADEDNRIPLGSAIQMAKENDLFPLDLLDRAKNLSTFRNSLVHRKPLSALNSFCARFLDEGIHPDRILKNVAREAIDLKFAFVQAVTEQ